MKKLGFKNYFFIGIGGIGMSSLARYLKLKEKNVSGYDLNQSKITNQLNDLEIKIIHREQIDLIEKIYLNVEDTIIIYTPAIQSNNILYKYFNENNFKIIKRSDLLQLITHDKFTIAVSGTHGKTTVTSLLTNIFSHSDIEFTSFSGGIMKNFNSNLHVQGDKIFIVEADEYDKSFLKLNPDILCINNIDEDHLDVYDDYNDLKYSFEKFIKQIKRDGRLIFNENLNLNGKSFGIKKESNYKLHNIVFKNLKSIFDVEYENIFLKNIELNMVGFHNCLNALAAIAISLEFNIPKEIIKKGLKEFKGIERRFSVELTDPVVYIDDYAHHPSEINSVYKTLSDLFPKKKKFAIFQPHLYSRTRDFMDDFANSLSNFDKVALLDIYPAREESIPGISSEKLLEKIEVFDKSLTDENGVINIINQNDNEVVVTMGAGDIGNLVNKIKKEIAVEI